MKITAETTDEQIMESVKAACRNLQDLAAKGIESGWGDHESLAGATNGVAAAEGRATVRAALRNYLHFMDERGEEPDVHRAREVLHEQLAVSPNDMWSGRTNDARRAFNDGKRDEVREQLGYWSVR